MTDDAPTTEDAPTTDDVPTTDDDAMLRAFAEQLVEAAAAVLPSWVERCVIARVEAWQGAVPDEVRAAAASAGLAARDEATAELQALLGRDVDEQRGNPLAVLRAAVRFPTAVLAAAGVPPVVRDDFAERTFPADVYDLSPASFADVDPSLHDPGLTWGAAKAHVVLRRRRAEGLR